MALALVTGGGVRVGRAIALGLGRAGYDVVVHANRSVTAAEQVASELGHMGRAAFVEVADLSSSTAVRAMAERVNAQHAALDVLVNSAAAYEHQPFEQVSLEALDRMLSVNLVAPFLLTQALLPLLRRGERPCIVNITDMALTHAYTGTHFMAHYLASKAALEQLTRAWALELGPAVRVNAVAPGPVAMGAATTEGQREEILGRVPLGREGSPEDVAEAVVFLARAPYVSGQTLRVDGGLSVT